MHIVLSQSLYLNTLDRDGASYLLTPRFAEPRPLSLDIAHRALRSRVIGKFRSAHPQQPDTVSRSALLEPTGTISLVVTRQLRERQRCQ